MSCRTFVRWLDEGRPAAGAAGGRAHAASCARCAAALRAALEIEALLAQPAAPAPAGFAVRVMARIAAPQPTASARRRAAWAPPDTVSWLAAAAAEPATLLAFAVAGLMAWGRGLIWSFAVAFAAGAGSPSRVIAPELLQRPEVAAGLGLAFLPLAGLVAWVVFRAAERWVGAARVAPRPR